MPFKCLWTVKRSQEVKIDLFLCAAPGSSSYKFFFKLSTSSMRQLLSSHPVWLVRSCAASPCSGWVVKLRNCLFMACPFLKTRQCTVIKYVIQSGDGWGCTKYLLQTLESGVWGQTLLYRTSHNFKLIILESVLLLKLHTRSFLHHHDTGSSLVVWWFCSWFGWQGFKSDLRSARKHCSLQLCGGQTLPWR